MIQSQFLALEPFVAVLTSVAVAQINIFAANFLMTVGDINVIDQSDNRRHKKPWPEFTAVMLSHDCCALDNQLQGISNDRDLGRLECTTEYKHGFVDYAGQTFPPEWSREADSNRCDVFTKDTFYLLNYLDAKTSISPNRIKSSDFCEPFHFFLEKMPMTPVPMTEFQFQVAHFVQQYLQVKAGCKLYSAVNLNGVFASVHLPKFPFVFAAYSSRKNLICRTIISDTTVFDYITPEKPSVSG